MCCCLVWAKRAHHVQPLLHRLSRGWEENDLKNDPKNDPTGVPMTTSVLRFCKGRGIVPLPITRATAHDSVRRTHGVSSHTRRLHCYRRFLRDAVLGLRKGAPLGVQCTLLEVANLVVGISDCTFEKGEKPLCRLYRKV